MGTDILKYSKRRKCFITMKMLIYRLDSCMDKAISLCQEKAKNYGFLYFVEDLFVQY